MTIQSTRHTDMHWVFRLSDGTKCSVGKYVANEGIEEGVATEQEAIGVLKQNYPDLIED